MKNFNKDFLVKDIIDQLKLALNKFGTYAFDDKGPQEIMDLNPIVENLNSIPVQDCINVLVEVCQSYFKQQYCVSLVGAILVLMQDVDDERWDALMSHPELQEAYDY